jgi:hypothetical protein
VFYPFLLIMRSVGRINMLLCINLGGIVAF